MLQCWISCYWHKIFRPVTVLFCGAHSLVFHHRHCRKHTYTESVGRKWQRKLSHKENISMSAKSQTQPRKLDRVFLCIHLGHYFGNDVCNRFGGMLRRKRFHKWKSAGVFVCIQSFVMHIYLIDYKVVGDEGSPELSCFPFTSEVKTGNSKTTGHHMNYRTFILCRWWNVFFPLCSQRLDRYELWIVAVTSASIAQLF